MPRRTFTGVRLSETGRDAIQYYADRETGGNVSEMIRRLLAEALTARQRRAGLK